MATETKKKKIAKGRHLSAFKRQRQTVKRTERNKSKRSFMRNEVKKFKADPKKENLKKTLSAVDAAVSQGIIPKKRGSRIVSRLTLLAQD